MAAIFLKIGFSTDLVRAMGWTLIHSLWQGLILTAIAGLFILFARKATSSIRYKVLSALFVIFIIGCSATFISEWQAAAGNIEAAGSLLQNQVAVVDADLSFKSSSSGSFIFLDRFAGYFNEHAVLFVAVWFAVFLIKAIRLGASVSYAQRIRYYKTSGNVEWQDRMTTLAQSLGIRKLISLRESAIINVPVAIGLFKPVILFPLGLLVNLPADQVEAILLHELAHIRRRDYFINLLQCIGEAIFFFNPSVRWLSEKIREEREHCCDDIAISITKNKSALVHALIAFQDYQPAQFAAPAFPGKKYHLLHRVRRIVGNKNENLNNMEKFLLASGLALTALLTLTFGAGKAQQKNDTIRTKQVRQSTTATVIVRDTVPEVIKDTTEIELREVVFKTIRDTVPESMTGNIDRTIDGKKYRIEIKNNVMVGLEIDGKSIPSDKFGDYKTVTDAIIAEMKVDMSKAREDRKRATKQRAVAALERKISEQKRVEGFWKVRLDKPVLEEVILDKPERLEKKERLEKEEKHEKLEKIEKLEKLEREHAKLSHEYNIEQQKRELLQQKLIAEARHNKESDKKGERMSEESSFLAKKLLEQSIQEKNVKENYHRNARELEDKKRIMNEDRERLRIESKMEAVRKMERSTLTKRDVQKNREDAMLARQQSTYDKKNAEALRTSLIVNLVEDKIIKEGDKFTIELSNDSMIINGEKQPEKIHEKYKAKYGIGEGRRISFNVE